MLEHELQDVRLLLRADIKPHNAHERTYNVPTLNEVAVILPTQDVESLKIAYRDVLIQQKGGYTKTIRETHALYDPLHYVCFHPYASFGYANYI